MSAYAGVARYLDPAAPARAGRALFLDRDGVLNVDRGYVHTPADTQWIDGIFALVRAARGAGLLPIVVTNQAGIARGLYDEAAFLDYTRWVHAQFVAADAPLAATFYCPHHPEHGVGELRRACGCRKPGPDMIRAAQETFGLDLGACVLLGDKPSDIAAGEAAGVGCNLRVDRPLAQLPLPWGRDGH